ncbi:MAG: hypothetical protein ACYC4S_02320 [Rhodoferax sp.]
MEKAMAEGIRLFEQEGWIQRAAWAAQLQIETLCEAQMNFT